MLVWSAAAARGGAPALAKTLPPDTSDAIIVKLHDATTATLDARDKAGLVAAGAAMAGAVRAIGLSRLPRFAATAATAAEDALAASATLRATLAGAETGGELTIEAGPFAVAAGVAAGALTGFVASQLGASITATPVPPPQRRCCRRRSRRHCPRPAGTTTADPVRSTGAALPSAPKTATVLPGAPINPPQAATIFEAKPTPEEAARRAAIIAKKGLPAADKPHPYIPPKTWTSSQPPPRGPNRGYLDETGVEWTLKKGKIRGSRHWDVLLSRRTSFKCNDQWCNPSWNRPK